MPYAREIAMAYESIRKAGTTVVLHRDARGGYDPVRDVFELPQGTQTTEGVAVKIPPGSIAWRAPESVEDRETSDFLVAALGLTFPPSPGVVMEFVGQAWDIINAEPLEPDGVPIIYTVRGAK